MMTRYETEPTPEFNARCLDIVQQWSTGALPFPEAAAELTALGQTPFAHNHPVNQGRVEQLLGYMNSYRGSLNTAIRHYERARALYNIAGNQRRIAICDLNMGEAYRYKGDFKRAQNLFDKARAAFREVGDMESEAMTLGNRGQMFLSMDRDQLAFADLQESLRLTLASDEDSTDRTGMLCELHHALTLYYLKHQQHQEAWQQALSALDIAEQTQQPLELGYANRATAEALTITNYTPKPTIAANPDIYYQTANEAFQEINAEGEIARTMFAQARSLARRGRRMTAARKLQMAMAIFSRLGMVHDAAKAAEAQRDML